MRAHAHIETDRREPWLFGEPWTRLIRKAIETRYMLLPYWYTQFYESSVRGVPIMRPLFFEHPDDASLFAIDHQFYVGPSLLVHPIASPGVTDSIAICLPRNEVGSFRLNRVHVRACMFFLLYLDVVRVSRLSSSRREGCVFWKRAHQAKPGKDPSLCARG